MIFEWECIHASENNDVTWRAPVFGGWIVRHQDEYERSIPDHYNTDHVMTFSMVFVPDPNHEWNIDE